ncbi:hypothetical protein KPL70_022592 [Citrus sinensis]|nr:hypothetical protein KPL70_022592 [Citrus sinensis]
MAEDLCSFTKDTFNLKSPKKSPLVLRMLVLVFVMVCGVYICSVCVKQISARTKSEFLNVQVIERPCPVPNIEPWEIPYVHYPKPKTYSRAECACNPVRYFAILSMQRSGSGCSASKNECTAAVGLKWMLNQNQHSRNQVSILSGCEQYGNRTLLNVLFDVVYTITTSEVRSCGVRDKHHEEIAEYFRTRGVSAIFLFRRNQLRRMISVLANSYDRNAKLLNGTHKSHVHSPHEAEILARYKPLINATLLIRDMKQVEDTQTKALEYFKSTRHIIVYYEDILKNHTKLADIQEFLKVPQRDLRSRQVKIHRGPLANYVQNWDDVQKALKGTQYESFLHGEYRK